MANGKAHGGNPLEGKASAWFGGGTGAAFFVLCAFLAIATQGFGGTIAMYNFKERPAGASAIGVTITNAMGAAHSGTASATVTGSIVYSSDAPGRFIVDPAGVVVSKPRSLFFSGRSDSPVGTGANVAFDAINDAISTCQTTNFTIEFFMKMSPASYVNCSMIQYDAGWYQSSMEAYDIRSQMNIWIMNATGRSYRFGANYTPAGQFVFAKTLNESVCNAWHHFAFVMNGTNLVCYLDHSYVYADNSGKALFGMKFGGPSSGPLNVGMNNYQGGICGLRVSDRALSPTTFLRASDSYPNGDTLTHLNFDALTADTDVDGDIPNVSFLNVGNGVAVAGPDGSHPTASAVVNKTFTYEGDAKISTNKCSLRLTACAPEYGSANFLRGPGLKIPRTSSFTQYLSQDGSCTLEAFFKYDADGFREKINSLSNPRTRMCIMGQGNTGSNQTYVWLLFYDVSNAKMYMYVHATGPGGEAYLTSPSYAVPGGLQGRWCHIATTFDKAAQTFCVYLDHELFFTYRLDDSSAGVGTKVRYTGKSNFYHFVGAMDPCANGNVFNGWVDDVRLTAGVLPVSRFLRQENRRGCVIGIW